MHQGLLKADEQAGAEDTFDIGQVFNVLWRGKLFLMVCAVLAVLAGGYNAYVVATPIYSATSVIMLNTRPEQVVNLEGVMGGLSNDATVVNTELEVLKSRELVGKVVDRLDLVNDPEFNLRLSDPSMLALTRTWVRRLFRGAAPDLDVPDAVEQERIRNAVITAVNDRLAISNVSRSLVFRIVARTTDGTKSARIADALAEAYILNQIEVKYDATEQATTWLTDRVAELQVALENAENRVKAHRTGTDLVSFEALQTLEVQLKVLRDRIRDTGVQAGAARARLAALEAAETPEARAEAADDAILRRLLPRLDTGGSEDRETFTQRYDTLVQQARLNLQRSEEQLASLRDSEAEMEQRIERQNADLITLQQLDREAEASRLLYEHFLNRLKETSAQQGVQQADSRILSRAVVPLFPSEPDKSMMLLISGFLGLFLGSVFLFLRELRSSTFRIPETLERKTGYPVIGQVPKIPGRNRWRNIAYLAEMPTSAAAESVRNLRTSVLMSNLDRPPQVIMLCSSVPGEGKTTLSWALAQNFAGMGRRTLLIEGDIRRRIFSQHMDASRNGGLVAVMTREITVAEAVSHDETAGIDVLMSGQSPANPADLLSSQRFVELLQELRGLYDQIIIDTPPVLVVPDARIIAQHVDTTIFVVKWDATPSDQVLASLRAFESAGHRVGGFALNGINPRGVRRYGYGANYGAYGSYGSKYYNN